MRKVRPNELTYSESGWKASLGPGVRGLRADGFDGGAAARAADGTRLCVPDIVLADDRAGAG
jgi:hypothetical protein